MIFLIRHAPAGDRIRWAIAGKVDALRPITPKGKKAFRQAARALSKHHRLKFVLSSEMARSIQTAEELLVFNPKAHFAASTLVGEEFEVLKLARMIRHLERLHGTVAVVGHEPDMSQLLAYLVTGRSNVFGRMPKGAVACLESFGKKCQLHWLLSMEQLRGWK